MTLIIKFFKAFCIWQNVFPSFRDPQVLTVKVEKQELKVSQEKKDHQDQTVSLDHQEPQVHLDLQVSKDQTDQKDNT